MVNVWLQLRTKKKVVRKLMLRVLCRSVHSKKARVYNPRCDFPVVLYTHFRACEIWLQKFTVNCELKSNWGREKFCDFQMENPIRRVLECTFGDTSAVTSSKAGVVLRILT